jgi:hypothetical protein
LKQSCEFAPISSSQSSSLQEPTAAAETINKHNYNQPPRPLFLPLLLLLMSNDVEWFWFCCMYQHLCFPATLRQHGFSIWLYYYTVAEHL